MSIHSSTHTHSNAGGQTTVTTGKVKQGGPVRDGLFRTVVCVSDCVIESQDEGVDYSK